MRASLLSKKKSFDTYPDHKLPYLFSTTDKLPKNVVTNNVEMNTYIVPSFPWISMSHLTPSQVKSSQHLNSLNSSILRCFQLYLLTGRPLTTIVHSSCMGKNKTIHKGFDINTSKLVEEFLNGRRRYGKCYCLWISLILQVFHL